MKIAVFILSALLLIGCNGGRDDALNSDPASTSDDTTEAERLYQHFNQFADSSS